LLIYVLTAGYHSGVMPVISMGLCPGFASGRIITTPTRELSNTIVILVTPNRLDNGYRDYSEADLQLLLRIKLLRLLHVSVDEIKELKDGNKSLSEIISKQFDELEKEKQEVSYAQDICHAMKEDKASFSDLDVKKYLEGIELRTK
jgi:DNA-binding transcriptional MerR regulator